MRLKFQKGKYLEKYFSVYNQIKLLLEYPCYDIHLNITLILIPDYLGLRYVRNISNPIQRVWSSLHHFHLIRKFYAAFVNIENFKNLTLNKYFDMCWNTRNIGHISQYNNFLMFYSYCLFSFPFTFLQWIYYEPNFKYRSNNGWIMDQFNWQP